MLSIIFPSSVWYMVGVAFLLTGGFLFLRNISRFRRGLLFFGVLYFLFRTWIETEVMKEYAVWDVPIRIDLLLFIPLDVLCIWICVSAVLFPSSRK